jgi:hypothetical protein
MPNFGQLHKQSKEMLARQLDVLDRELKSNPDGLQANQVKVLLEISKWVADMAVIEEEEEKALTDPKERKRLQDRRAQEVYRYAKKNKVNELVTEGVPDKEKEARIGSQNCQDEPGYTLQEDPV